MHAVGILWPLADYCGATGTAGVIEAKDQIAFRRGEHRCPITGKTPQSMSAPVNETRAVTDELPGVD
jgi:hypothetical protein